MADNITLNTGSGGDTCAADDIGGIKHQRVKIQYGVDGSATDVSDTNPLPIDDAGGSITVDGTVTAELSATDNAVLDQIDSNTDYGAVIGGGAEATALRVTIADDSTGVISIDDNGGSLTVDNAGTFAVQVDGDSLTALQTIDNIVVVEDAQHNSGDSGVMSLAVRNDQLATLTSTDGDYAPLQVDRRGALYTTNAYDARDAFGRNTSASPYNDIDIQFFKAAPDQLTNVTTANSATAAVSSGGALFSSSTNTNGSVQAVTTEKTTYTSGSEVYCMFTAAFTAGIANSYMRIGLFDANEGFFLGYEGTSFGLTVRNNGSDGAQITSFSDDALDGSAGSKFTRAGTPEAIDYTKLNVFRIRFGWLGSAPVIWEVMAPDGHWVCFHKILYPNLQAVPSIRNANLPMTLDITKTAAAATDITIQTDCWGAGTIAGPRAADADELAFQTTTTLANGATYDSGVLSLSPEFSQVQTSILASHNGVITVTWYRDPSGTDAIRTLTITYTAADGYQYFAAPAFSPYVKYQFNNNSGSAQTDFYFDTKFLRRPIQPQIIRVDGTVQGGMVASVQRALITAYNGNSYTNVQATNAGNLKVSVEEISDGLDIGAGNAGSETQRVSISTDDVNLSAIKTAVEIIDNAISGSEMQVDVVGSLPAGTNAIGKLSANSGVDIGDVDVTSISAGSNLIGDVGISGARTSGGTTLYKNIDVDESEDQVKATAGQIYWIYAINMNAATRYLKIYNATAASVVVGTTVPSLTFPVPPNSTTGGGFVLQVPNGIAFSTAITIAATTGVADNDSGAPGANEVIVNLGYA